MKPIKVQVKGKYIDEGEYSLVFARYHNRALALVLNKGYERIATVTVNIEGVDLERDEVLVKTWGDNEGIAESLEDAGIFTFTGRVVPTGYEKAKIYRLNNQETEKSHSLNY